MGKKALGIGLTLLSIALWIGPIVAAFGSHGWDLRDTVAPDQNQLDHIENRFEGLIKEGSADDFFSVSESSISGYDFSLTVEFESPFNFSLTIEEFEATLSDKGVNLGSIEMVDDQVTIDEGERKSIRFSGTLTEEGKAHLQGGEIPTDVEISGGVLRVNAYDITVEVSLEEIQDGSGIF